MRSPQVQEAGWSECMMDNLGEGMRTPKVRKARWSKCRGEGWLCRPPSSDRIVTAVGVRSAQGRQQGEE